MTALTTQTAATPTVIHDWSMWIEANEAAVKLDVHPGHFRRRECPKLALQGMAVYCKPPAGGNPRWWINRKLAPLKLADGRLGEQRQVPQEEWLKLTQIQRDNAERRRACVMAFRDAQVHERGHQKTWIPPLVIQLRGRYPQIKISERSLRRWDNLYQVPADILKLVDDRGRDQKSMGDKAAWDFFAAIFLDERQPSIKTCWDRTEAWRKTQDPVPAWCSYASCKRQLQGARARIPVETQVRHRDPRKWRSQHAPFIEQDPERFDANQCWVADHRPLDLMCRIGDKIFRPYITIYQDWRSRKIVGWAMSENPDSTTILAAFRMAMLDPRNLGGPGVVWSDNGKDFVCVMFVGATKQMRRTIERVELDELSTQGIFGRLNIELHMSLAHCPQGKARCERVFATIGDHFDKSFPTYTGKNPEHKPEGLAKILKDKPHLVPAYEHVRERFAQWVIGHNASIDHDIEDLVDVDGSKLSRDAFFAKFGQARMPADPAAIDLCLQRFDRPVRVGRNGVTLKIGGMTRRYGQFMQELLRFKGTKQEVVASYDPDQLDVVRIYTHPQMTFVCDAPVNATTGIHSDPKRLEHVKELKRQQAARNKAQKVLEHKPELEYLSSEESLDLIAAEMDAPPVEREGTLQIRRTTLDGASKQIEQQGFRKAAGAEAHQVGDAPISRALPSVSRELQDFVQQHEPLPADDDLDAPLPSALPFTPPGADDDFDTLSSWSELEGRDD